MPRRVALVFPGQGSEAPGMGLALRAVDARAARLLVLASEACGVDVARAIERGGRALARTEVLQPTLLAVSLGAARYAALRGVEVAAVAGHSLGELSAVCFALDVPDEDAIALATLRGRLMADACVGMPGGLLAVRASDPVSHWPAIAAGLTLALHNAPDEYVLGGPLDAIERGARGLTVPSTRLSVAGAWHTDAMSVAVGPFRDALERILPHRPLRMPWIDADGVVPGGAETLGERLASSLARPVRWVAALEALARHGIADLAFLAPARVQRSLALRTLGGRCTLHALEEPGDVEALGVVG